MQKQFKQYNITAKKKADDISLYSKYTILLTMTKPRSPFSVYFMIEDPKDDWLINLVRFKTKTGEIAYEAMFIKPDFEKEIESYEKDGFIKAKV